MKSKLTFCLLLIVSIFVTDLTFAQVIEDESISSTNYENSPVYGSSSTRGVTYFSVPGRAYIGSTAVRRFGYYATGINKLQLSDPVTSPNPLQYTKRLPVSGVGSIKHMTGQLQSRLNTRLPSLKVDSSPNSEPFSYGSNQAQGVDVKETENKQEKGTFKYKYAFDLARRANNNAFLKQLKNANASRMYNRKKVLLLGNRSGRLSYQRNSLQMSLMNKTSRVRRNSSSAGYSTSSVLFSK